MDATFDHFIHVGIIVKDLDLAIKSYEKLGIGPWDEIVEFGCSEDAKNMHVNGKTYENDMFVRYSKARNLGVEFELIEPLGPSPYRGWMEEHGPGIHHIEMFSRNADDPVDGMVDTCNEISGGRKLWIDGKLTDDAGNTTYKWAYYDLRPETGMIVEIAGNEAG